MNIVGDFHGFLSKNFTISVIASLIIFNILSSLLEGVISPLFLTYADPEDKLSDLNFTINRYYVIKVGSFLKQLVLGLFIILVLSQVDKLFQ